MRPALWPTGAVSVANNTFWWPARTVSEVDETPLWPAETVSKADETPSSPSGAVSEVDETPSRRPLTCTEGLNRNGPCGALGVSLGTGTIPVGH
jgi:hypothetical protein